MICVDFFVDVRISPNDSIQILIFTVKFWWLFGLNWTAPWDTNIVSRFFLVGQSYRYIIVIFVGHYYWTITKNVKSCYRKPLVQSFITEIAAKMISGHMAHSHQRRLWLWLTRSWPRKIITAPLSVHDLLYLRRPDMLLQKLKAKRPKSIHQISTDKTLIPLFIYTHADQLSIINILSFL